MNDTLSEPQEHLRLVFDETQRFADCVLSSRIPRKYMQQRSAENEALPGGGDMRTVPEEAKIRKVS